MWIYIFVQTFSTMKIKLLLLGISFFITTQTFSQKHQISAGMGLGSTVQILDSFLEMGSGISYIFFNSFFLEKTENIGEFRISYAYTPKEHWRFGGAFSYNQSKFEAINGLEKIGDKKNNYYTLAAETSYAFLNKERIKLYALLGAGATFTTVESKNFITNRSSSSQGTIFNFQITPIGFRYGKQWGGFAELGFGYRGLASFGVFYIL